MKAKDLVIGNKYVPIAKTVNSATGSRDESAEWNSAKQANQPYLYYTGVHLDIFDCKYYHCFSSTAPRVNIKGYGDYFMPKDVVLYVESSNGHVYKRGDRAVIIGDNSRHEIKIGTEVTVEESFTATVKERLSEYVRRFYNLDMSEYVTRFYSLVGYDEIVSHSDLMPVVDQETQLVKENKKVLEVEREFKNMTQRNYLVIKSDSFPLYKAFKEECEKIGWKFNPFDEETAFRARERALWLGNRMTFMNGTPSFAFSETNRQPDYYLGHEFNDALMAAKDLYKRLIGKSELKLNSEYTARLDFETETVHVGCQKVPFSKVAQLMDLIKNNNQ